MFTNKCGTMNKQLELLISIKFVKLKTILCLLLTSLKHFTFYSAHNNTQQQQHCLVCVCTAHDNAAAALYRPIQ